MSLTPHTYSSRRFVPSGGGNWSIESTPHTQKFVSPHSPSRWRELVAINASTLAPQWLVETLPEWVAPESAMGNEHLLGTLMWSIASQACARWTKGTSTDRAEIEARAQKTLVTLSLINEHFSVDTPHNEEHLRARDVIETCVYSNMVGIDGKDGKPILPGIAVNMEISFGRGGFHYDPDFFGSSWDGESLGAVLAKSLENEKLGEARLSAILPAFNSGGFTVIGVVAASAWAAGVEELANKTFRLSSSHSGINSNMSCDL